MRYFRPKVDEFFLTFFMLWQGTRWGKEEEKGGQGTNV